VAAPAFERYNPDMRYVNPLSFIDDAGAAAAGCRSAQLVPSSEVIHAAEGKGARPRQPREPRVVYSGFQLRASVLEAPRQVVDPVDDSLLVTDAEVEHGEGEGVDVWGCDPVGCRSLGGISFG